MRTTQSGFTAVLCLALGVSAFGARTASAQPKQKQQSKKDSERADRTLDKQMAWEQRVMGDDDAKRAEMKKIAAAQKLAEEGRRNPAPPPPPKVKDPNKEGVRAKQEASIGLPIESDQQPQQARAAKRGAPAKKAPEASSSANDELGALVASSLAEEHAGGGDASANHRAAGGGQGRSAGVAAKAQGGGKGRHAARGGKHVRSGGGARGASASGEPSSLDKMFAASAN